MKEGERKCNEIERRKKTGKKTGEKGQGKKTREKNLEHHTIVVVFFGSFIRKLISFFLTKRTIS